MRSNITATQFREYLSLSFDYKVTGTLCYGTSFPEEAVNNLKKCLSDIDTNTELISFDNPVLHSVREINIGDKKIWFVVAYGGAELSEYLHLACLFGSQKNILVGSCGGLKSGMKSGDFIVPTSSYGQESSVRIYNRREAIQYPDKELGESLEKKLSDDNNKVWKGPMVTCQGSLGQTEEDVRQWSAEGYFGVDMETSTVFAVSNHFSVPSAASVYVADNIVEGQTPLSEDFAEQADMRQQRRYRQIQVALEELLA